MCIKGPNVSVSNFSFATAFSSVDVALWSLTLSILAEATSWLSETANVLPFNSSFAYIIKLIVLCKGQFFAKI